MKKKILMIGIIVLALIIIVFLKTKKIVEPDIAPVAKIHHSEMLGIDAGTQYTYSIYPDENNTYLYIKSRGMTTIAGPTERENISHGKLKQKSDLQKIEKDIEKDKRNDTQQDISYYYIKKEETQKCNSLDELGDKLFATSKNESITFTQYEAGSSNKIKEMQMTSSEDIKQVEQFVKQLRPLSDREMVNLALLQEVEIQYGDFISIGVQLGESQYCYYSNKNENISSLAKMPKELYEWVCEKLN